MLVGYSLFRPACGQPQLYAGLGDACRAVIRHDVQRWPSAQSALQQVNDPDTCLDRWALRLLRDLVTAHQRNPDAEIQIVDAQGGTHCDDTPSATPTPEDEGRRDE